MVSVRKTEIEQIDQTLLPGIDKTERLLMKDLLGFQDSIEELEEQLYLAKKAEKEFGSLEKRVRVLCEQYMAMRSVHRAMLPTSAVREFWCARRASLPLPTVIVPRFCIHTTFDFLSRTAFVNTK